VQPQNRYPRNRLEYYAYKLFIDTGNWVLVEPPQVPRRKDVAKQGLPPSEITLAELLSASGYETGILGKWHLGFNPSFIPNNRGFDYQYGFYEAFSLYAPVDSPDVVNYRHDYFANKHIWAQERKGSCAIRRNDRIIEEDEYLTTRIAEEAADYIEENRAEPFFLFVSFSAPHTPFQAPQKYYQAFSHVKDENKRVYYAMIKALDDGVGMIMERLRALELEEETLVVFASDNGGATYTGATDNAPLKGGKFTNFEGGINIPFMMKWKGVLEPGTVYEKPVSLVDVFATAASAAYAPLPSDRDYDGVDLIPYCTGETTGPPHQALYWRAAYNKAIRMGEWKLIIDEQADRKLLYNMETDKVERRNVAEQYPQVVERIERVLSLWEKTLEEPLWPRVMDYRFEVNGKEFMFAL
jgi:arylsulfatase A-like enzyme